MIDFERNKRQQENFGIVQFNRIQCSPAPVLFGADVQTNNLICLTISKNAYVTDDKLTGRHYAPSSKITDEVVQVVMSHAQFADLITCMNIGEGIPCTITRCNGTKLEPIAKDAVDNVIDAERKTIQEYGDEILADIDEMQQKIDEIMQKPSIGKADRELIRKYTNYIHQAMHENMPFYVRKAGESVEKLVERAKTEVGASIQSAMIQAGCSALKLEMVNNVQAQLTD